MSTFTCQLAFHDTPNIQDVAAAFGKEGEHLKTSDPQEVMEHIHKVNEGDPRLRRNHRLIVDGTDEYWLNAVTISPEGKVSWRSDSPSAKLERE